MSQELESISPAEAKEMYRRERKGEVSERTLQAHHYRLKQFIRWCGEVEGIDNLNNLSGRDLQRFKTWRREDGDLNKVSVHTQLGTLRVFIRWCGSINAVEPDLHEKFEALIPTLDKTDEQNESILDRDDAKDLLEYLRKFEHASRPHVITEILWHTGIRLGALYSVDMDDYDPEEERLELHHRPDTGTTLKNGREGERMIALNAEVCRIIEDWVEHHRHEVQDEHDREPLLTSRNSRMSPTTIRNTVYRVTRPCYYTNECPEGRDPDECEANRYPHYSKCPVNVSPHDIRRGSITHFLTEDVPEKVVSDRMNVGQDVLDKHYDKRDEEVKVEQRRDYINGI